MNDVKRFLQTAALRPVECDIEQRILRSVIFATTGVAADGWIILPSGMLLERYLKNPIVTARHLINPTGETTADSNEPCVMANALRLESGQMELVAEVQFADTESAREWAYLYGINGEKRAYMRGWSIEAPVLERSAVNWADAKKLAGQYWDDTLAQRLQAKLSAVAVATSSELRAVAMVPAGADRAALTRAAASGIRAAGEILVRMDFEAASTELAEVKRQMAEYETMWGETDARLIRLERDIQALRGEGASAAARGNSEATLQAVRELRLIVLGNET